MAQSLSDVSVETKLKAVNVLAAAAEIWEPGPRYLPDVIYELKPDIKTRDAAMMTLNAFAWDEGFECWEPYELMLRSVHLVSPAVTVLRIIRFLTRSAG